MAAAPNLYSPSQDAVTAGDKDADRGDVMKEVRLRQRWHFAEFLTKESRRMQGPVTMLYEQ